MKLLLVEDEKNIADPIIRILSKRNFVVDYAQDGIEGKEKYEEGTYDCLILDLNLPGIDGIELAKYIREKDSDTPILMLTARSQIYDKLAGFETGADDYLTKPFDMEELIARINAIIKRSSVNKIVELEIPDIRLIPDQNKIIFEKSKLEETLSNKETGVLEYLIRNKGRVVSTEELLEHVWDTNINVFTDTVKTHMKTLRKKMGDSSELIKTIKGKGYILDY